MRGFPIQLVLIAGLLSSVGCAETYAGDSSTTSAVAYGRDAQEAYENALEAFRRENCFDADPAFRRVRREYPYSRFAALAELRIADCKFMQGQYVEAISAYRQFVRFRPSHSQVEYARYRTAESYFEQIPSEWLLSPPSHERDTGSTRDALRHMRRFLLDYPDSSRHDDAAVIIQSCLDLLAHHELYAAKFYLRRDAFPAVVNRLQTLLNSYEGASVEPEALLILAQTFEQMDDQDRARATYQELVQRFPDSEEAPEARQAIAN